MIQFFFLDADIDLAIEQSQLGLFFNAGQCCIAGSRVYVHEKIYDEFVKRSAERAKTIKVVHFSVFLSSFQSNLVFFFKVGDPTHAATNQGPQVDADQMNKILGYINKGKSEGARLLAGGNRVGKKGLCLI